MKPHGTEVAEHIVRRRISKSVRIKRRTLSKGIRGGRRRGCDEQIHTRKHFGDFPTDHVGLTKSLGIVRRLIVSRLNDPVASERLVTPARSCACPKAGRSAKPTTALVPATRKALGLERVASCVTHGNGAPTRHPSPVYPAARRPSSWRIAGSRTMRIQSSFFLVTMYRSSSPDPPGRFDAKNSVLPSWEIAGCISSEDEFAANPRFSGMDHGPLRSSRVEVQRSVRPREPSRFEKKKTSRPSRRRGRAGVLDNAVQLDDWLGRTEGPILSEHAHIDVGASGSAWPIAGDEEELLSPYAQQPWAGVVGSRVDGLTHVHRSLPGEIIMLVLTERHPDIETAEATGTIADEEHIMPVARERGRLFDRGGVHARSDVHRRAPSGILILALGDPDVLVAAGATRAVGREVEAETIPGDRRSFVVGCRVNDGTEVLRVPTSRRSALQRLANQRAAPTTRGRVERPFETSLPPFFEPLS